MFVRRNGAGEKGERSELPLTFMHARAYSHRKQKGVQADAPDSSLEIV